VNFNHGGISYIGDLTISGGSMDSSSKIRVTNSFSWTGTSTLTTSFNMELTATCTSLISGTGNRNLYGTLMNEGLCTHTGGSLRLQTGGSIENNGTYTFDGATYVIGTAGDGFSNNGIINKNNSNELNFFTSIEQYGGGVLNINEGTMKLLWGGISSGTTSINISSGATLNFNSGTYAFGSNNNISGLGIIEYSGATITSIGNVNLSGETKISGGTINFNQSTTNIGKLSLSGGTIQGSSQIIVSNQFSWSGTSTISISDTLKIANTATVLIFNNGSKNLYSPMINEGTISHTGGNFRFYPGGSLENNGTYNLNGPTSIYDNGGGSFDNNGIFEHQANGTLSLNPDFNNNINGTVKGKGTLQFTNLTNNGSFVADATTGTLNLTGTFDNGSSLEIGFDDAAHGEVIVSGDITLSGSLDATVIGTVPPGTYKILSTTSGTISGTFDSQNISSDFSLQYSPTEVNLLVSLLPVELIDFKILALREGVLLSWQTASEINSESFIIEHSPEGQNFHPIGEVKAAGISTTIQNYQFVHETPTNGTNYYRLRQQDIDGQFEYSDLRVLNFYNFKKEVSVYPNPTLGQITIKNQSDKEFKMTVTDLSGKVIYARAGITPGATTLDLAGLPKSMYTLEIFDDFSSYKEKVMILE
jgi:hypothetical protein